MVPDQSASKKRERILAIVAVAGLVVAILGVLRDYYGWGDPPASQPTITSTPPPSPGSPTGAVPPTNSATGPTASIRTAPPPVAPVDPVPARAPEHVVLAPARGLDLDTVPATPTAPDDDRADILTTSLYDVDPGRGVTLSAPIRERPTAAGCRARLGTADVPSFGPEREQFICVRTTEDNLVLVQYHGLDNDEPVFVFTVSAPE